MSLTLRAFFGKVMDSLSRGQVQNMIRLLYDTVTLFVGWKSNGKNIRLIYGIATSILLVL